MKIVHAADLHIDSPLRGLDRYDGAPVERLRGATRRALENLVALCIEGRADALLLAGDVFDGGWKDYSTGLFFAAQMTRLREAGVPVVLVRGNHDAVSSVVKALRLPENVHEVSAKKPATFELPNVGLAVHGQSFSERIMSDDLAAKYPARVGGVFNVGLLHTSIDGREGHAPYAPTSVEIMSAKGYDYWALGHVHAREVVSTEPYIVYSGNLQGRHARETGAKGATVIHVENGAVKKLEHHALDVVRWDSLDVDVSAASDAAEAIDLVRDAVGARSTAAEGRILAARVTLTGATRANGAIRRDAERFVNELRSVANDTLGDGVWLEKIRLQVRTHLDFDRIREEQSAVGHLARRLASIKGDDAELTALGAELAELEKKLPPELREGENAFHLTDPATLRALLEDVEQMLVPRLLERQLGRRRLMRLAKLDLLAYGHFRGVSLDFRAPGLHVVLGRNEAGKSTTLRAITGLLYGIDRTTPDAHVHKPTELRIGGTLEHDGERVRVVRRKGNSNTLLDAQDKPIDEAVLRRLLGGVTQETFVHAYGLDHITLAEGANALLEGKGDLGESLFDASVGGGGEVQRILSDLAREADAIYRPRGTALPLNDAMKAFQDASKQVKERRTLPEAYTQQQEGLATETEERDACLAKKRELETKRALIARARARAPKERQRQHLIDSRAKLGAVPMHLARIDDLKERFGAYERDVEQLREQRAEVERLSDRLGEAMRRAGVKSDRSDNNGPELELEAFRLDAGTEGKVSSLLIDRGKLLDRIDAANVEIGRAERNLLRLHPSEPASSDSATRDALEAALDRARKLGDIEDRIAMERAKLDRQEQALTTKMTGLRGRVAWGSAPAEEPPRGRAKDAATRGRAKSAERGPEPRTLASFVALPLPSVSALDALAAKGTDLARKTSRQDERIEELEREAASLDKQVASLAGDFAPPDAAALRDAREARDAAWRALRLADGKARAPAELELEPLLREADSLADRMIREADRVTTLARLRAEAEANRVELEKARAERGKLEAAERLIERDLYALFLPAHLVPSQVADMRQWLDRHAQLADEYARLTEARGIIDAEAAKVARAVADLATVLLPKTRKRTKTEAQLSLLGGSSTTAPDPAEPVVAARLTDLVASATTRLNAMVEARRAAEAIDEQEQARDERIELRRTCNEQLTVVTKKLAEILAPIGLASDAPADEVNRAIEALREMFNIADRRTEAVARVREAQVVTADFESALARCLADAASDLVGADAAARQLFDRARQASESTAQLANVEEQLAQLGEPVPAEALENIVDLEASEDELREQIDELDIDIARFTENIGGLRAGLDSFRAEESAAEAASAAEQHLARVRDGAERWARARLASIILAREIERYREENQGPLLTSASSLFARLTLDAYSGIKAGFDEKDRPALRCVRKDGSEVDVTGLSDGTRDQLYLSLRLASLLRRADVAPSMPLILDDVLIQLDDPRASAALTVLAEVSRKMQVLFFTHHEHLVDLARKAVDPSELVIHSLGSAAVNVGGLAAVLR